MSPHGAPKRFRVALSFPGEHRSRVKAMAELLAVELGREKILDDQWYRHEFSRANLGVYLPNLYHDESELLVFFHCKAYEEKLGSAQHHLDLVGR